MPTAFNLFIKPSTVSVLVTLIVRLSPLTSKTAVPAWVKLMLSNEDVKVAP